MNMDHMWCYLVVAVLLLGLQEQVTAVRCRYCASLTINGIEDRSPGYDSNCRYNPGLTQYLECANGCILVEYTSSLTVLGITSSSKYIERNCNNYGVSRDTCISGRSFETWIDGVIDDASIDYESIPDSFFDLIDYEGSACTCTTGDYCNSSLGLKPTMLLLIAAVFCGLYI